MILTSKIVRKSCWMIAIVFLVANLSLAQDTRTKKSVAKVEAKEGQSSNLKNEIKLNLAYAPFGYLEGAYERLLPANTSIGLGFGKSIKEDINIKYHVIAFYRLFFGQQAGAGFFIEANAAYWNEDYYSGNGENKGVGFAVGGKFFRGDRYHGEFVFGYGRNLSDNSSYFDGAYPRFAISMGYRF